MELGGNLLESLRHGAANNLDLSSPVQAQVVKLRFFVGMTAVDSAEGLGLSERTVKQCKGLAALAPPENRNCGRLLTCLLRALTIGNLMSVNPPEPSRQRLPHLAPLEFANQTSVILLTMCAHKRRPLLARAEIVALLLDCWREADHWLVGRWVAMPDHLHLFCAPAKAPATPVASWARFWRSQVTRRWPYRNETPIWQRDFFDRRLRSGESYRQKWLYLWENPIKAGMVARPEDWPYQGEMNALSWHEGA